MALPMFSQSMPVSNRCIVLTMVFTPDANVLPIKSQSMVSTIELMVSQSAFTHFVIVPPTLSQSIKSLMLWKAALIFSPMILPSSVKSPSAKAFFRRSTKSVTLVSMGTSSNIWDGSTDPSSFFVDLSDSTFSSSKLASCRFASFADLEVLSSDLA